MELFKLLGTIAIENDEAKKALKETSEHAEDTADKIQNTSDKADKSSNDMSGAFKRIGSAVVTYLSVDAIKNFGLSCINAAADVNAMESQFSQVFGELEGNASKSLSSIADKSGVAENRLKGSFTQIASFAKTTGMDTESALGLSERAMVAVADSAAFYDRSLEETTESLQSFLKGNFENDAALGLSCTETTRNAAANALYGKSFNELSESQKQLTLLQMVEDANKLSGAMGQASRESDTWANQTGNLQQTWNDFLAIIGSYVLPTAVDVVKTLAEKVTELAGKIPDLVNWFKEYKDVLGFVAVAIGVVTAAITAYNIVQAIKAAMDAAEVTTLGALIAMKLASAAATLAAVAPYLLVAAAIAAVIAIGVLLYKNWDEIKAKCIELGAKIKEKFNEIKASISNAVENAKQAVVNKFNAMKTSVVNAFSNMKSSVVNKFNEIKSGISDKINSAKDAVKSAIDKIKGFFNFSWSLPKLKMPHFSLKGKFSLDPPSVPKLSVDWYAKAMNAPILMNEPTIFGYNSATGQYMGGGEAGSEVVSGTNTLMNMISTAVSSQNAEMVYYLQRLIQILAEYFPQVLEAMDRDVVLDSGETVGALAPKMDKALGKLAARKERWA